MVGVTGVSLNLAHVSRESRENYAPWIPKSTEVGSQLNNIRQQFQQSELELDTSFSNTNLIQTIYFWTQNGSISS